jgi:(5-formylfuran-3-yl)methyl phosphate synthase
VTRLLVSVRSAAEALAALAGGADLIDVKEPRHGSLGAATPQVWREVAAAIGHARPLSAALGELLEFNAIDVGALEGYTYAKLGLAGCAPRPDWCERWQAALASLPAGLTTVAVAYADYESAAAPPPQEVCAVGQRFGCRALLVDTFDKRQGDVFDILGVERLIELFQQARRFDLRVVLAGSLRLARLDDALSLSPDYVAVRGAVCQHAREGNLSAELVRRWSEKVHATSQAPRASAVPGTLSAASATARKAASD